MDDELEIRAIPAKEFKQVTDALMRHGDKKVIRREIAKELRSALRPYAARAKGGIMAMHSSGGHGGVPLRASIARKVTPQTMLTARKTGVRIKVGKTPNIRKFALAGRYTNRRSWRRPVYGRAWIIQRGKPGWFDDVMEASESSARKAVANAMETVIRKIRGMK